MMRGASGREGGGVLTGTKVPDWGDIGGVFIRIGMLLLKKADWGYRAQSTQQVRVERHSQIT